MTENLAPSTPSTRFIAERGEAIYTDKCRSKLEKTSLGKFGAINIVNGSAIEPPGCLTFLRPAL